MNSRSKTMMRLYDAMLAAANGPRKNAIKVALYSLGYSGAARRVRLQYQEARKSWPT